MTRYPTFDRSRLELAELSIRGHELAAQAVRPLDATGDPYKHPEFEELVQYILEARRAGRPVILMMGAHPIKLGLSRYLIDLLERDLVTHLATNGGGLIHDFELALVGGTSEDVARWINAGQFGLWRETSRLNSVVNEAARSQLGLGEAVGRTIADEGFPFSDLSLAAAAWRQAVPFTCHISIGSDIVHAMGNCSGAAWGETSYTDFLIFARAIEELEGGVFLNVGTAVTGPEVYLKALSMARNVARQAGRSISRFVTAVFDLIELPTDFREGTPDRSHLQYYYRPWKTILVRTVADRGRSFYFCGDHRQTIPSLWRSLVSDECSAREPASTWLRIGGSPA